MTEEVKQASGRVLTFAAMITAMLGLLKLAFMVSEPHIASWVQGQVGPVIETTISDATRSIRDEIRTIGARISAMEDREQILGRDIVSFESHGNIITSTPVGGEARLTWNLVKHQDCGAPLVDALFRDAGGYTHRITNLSIVDETGRGVSLPQSDRPQTISYTGQIPSGRAVVAGPALGWVSLTYSSCIGRPQVTSPIVPFIVLDEE